MPILPRVTPQPVPSMTAQNWAPVSYTTQIADLTAGQTRMMPQAALQSGFNTPYYVDEIRFTAFSTVDSTIVTTASSLATIISFQLQTGSYFFSQSALGSLSSVPLCLFTPLYSGGAWLEDQAQGVASNTYRLFSTRRWCLPKPLWMPPGDIVQAAVSREATYGSDLGTNITTQMTIIGRALPPHAAKPATRCVPHIGWFMPAVGVTYSEATSQLKNPFMMPWNVQRMIMTTRSNQDFGAGHFSSQLGAGMVEDPTNVTQFVRTRVSDSLGYKITGSSKGGFVPMADVAQPSNDSSWTFGRPLPVDQNYNVAFDVNAGSTSDYPNSFPQIQPMVSLVGYREEVA